jgi:3-isopropylmalate dehydrogenase
MSAKIVLLPGDGIGPEVIESAVKVLREAAKIESFRIELQQGWIGGAAYERCGQPLDPATLETCLSADAVLLGAVGGPRWDKLPGAERPEAGLLQLRKALGVFANLRPVKARPVLAERTPYRSEILSGVDCVMVRELTGGLYFGEKHTDGESATDQCVYHRYEIERVTRVAAELARTRRKKLTSIDKANVLETSRLWRKTVTELVERDYPDLTLEHILVDAAAMYLAQRPSSFDVLLTENLFGDVLSDQSSTLAGSLGLLPSASLGGSVGLYEPIHGSAPDIAGKGIANPVGAILSVALMLRYSLARDSLAQRVESAVEQVLAAGYLTADLHPQRPVLTNDFTEAVCAALG